MTDTEKEHSFNSRKEYTYTSRLLMNQSDFPESNKWPK